jgi:hypothetical protein
MFSIVTLADGRKVDTMSREWLLETLARELLRRPLAQRREWLSRMEQKGDKAGADELRGVLQTLRSTRR